MCYVILDWSHMARKGVTPAPKYLLYFRERTQRPGALDTPGRISTRDAEMGCAASQSAAVRLQACSCGGRAASRGAAALLITDRRN